MRATLIQNDMAWADAQANCNRGRELLRNAPEADLYLFPEMFSTGFICDPRGVAEEMHDGSCPTLDMMREAAARRNAAVGGTLAVCENGRYYNSFFFVKPDGETHRYNKHHLFIFGGEDEFFTPGDERVVVEWRGVRFLLQICFDLRFPLWNRNRGDFDAIISLANWPEARASAWDILTRARAIENQCYMLAVNRIGEDPTGGYHGDSRIINPFGEILASGKWGEECYVSGEIDMEMLQRYWGKFPILAVADDTPPWAGAEPGKGGAAVPGIPEEGCKL